MPSFLWRACLAVFATLSLLSIGGICPAQVSFRIDDMQGDAERLEQVLQRRGSIDAALLPLRDFADLLSRQFGVPIELDRKRLEEAGVNEDAPITRRLDSIPLQAILQHGLSDIELTFVIRNHVILITTPEEAESRLTTKVYPVRDLVAYRVADGGKERYVEDYDSLIELITSTIAPDAWDEVGGPGSIAAFANASILVISQTDEIHREIEPLLVRLRQVKGLQGIPAEAFTPPADKTRSVSRRIPGRRAPDSPVRLTGASAQAWQVPHVYGGE